MLTRRSSPQHLLGFYDAALGERKVSREISNSIALPLLSSL